jgi:hypothetical protein
MVNTDFERICQSHASYDNYFARYIRRRAEDQAKIRFAEANSSHITVAHVIVIGSTVYPPPGFANSAMCTSPFSRLLTLPASAKRFVQLHKTLVLIAAGLG